MRLVIIVDWLLLVEVPVSLFLVLSILHDVVLADEQVLSALVVLSLSSLFEELNVLALQKLK